MKNLVTILIRFTFNGIEVETTFSGRNLAEAQLAAAKWLSLFVGVGSYKGDFESEILGEDRQRMEDACSAAKQNMKMGLVPMKLQLFAADKHEEYDEDNDNIVLAAVQQNGMALKHASARLQDQEDIVLAAVREYAYAIAYASPRLRKKPEIILAAMCGDPSLVERVSDKIRYAIVNNRKAMLEVIQQNGRAVLYVGDSLKKDHELYHNAVHQNPLVFVDFDVILQKQLIEEDPQILAELSSTINEMLEEDFSGYEQDFYDIFDEMDVEVAKQLVLSSETGWIFHQMYYFASSETQHAVDKEISM